MIWDVLAYVIQGLMLMAILSPCAFIAVDFFRRDHDLRDRPDHAEIHRLEYELGFRDDPPPGYYVANGDWQRPYLQRPTDEPGAVVYYNAADGKPFYAESLMSWSTALAAKLRDKDEADPAPPPRSGR